MGVDMTFREFIEHGPRHDREAPAIIILVPAFVVGLALILEILE